MKRKQKVFAFSQKKYMWTANRTHNAMKQHSEGYQKHQVNNDS
jgi:protoporphyrinogen oxidase